MNSNSPTEPDNFQQAWRTQSPQTFLTVDPALLQTAVQRNQRSFRATILFRDIREIGVAVLLLIYWFYAGLTQSLPWTWWLTVPALIFVAGFMLVDRWRHPQKPPEAGEPLLKSVQESLTQVDHQIWLLRNVFWWYLLPFTISIMAFFAHVTWLTSKDHGLGGLFAGFLFLGFLTSFLFAVYYFVYWLNQYAVRKQLQPQRNELAKLLKSLTDDDTTQLRGEYPLLLSQNPCKQLSPKQRLVIFVLAAVMFMIILAFAAVMFVLILRFAKYLGTLEF